MVPSGICFHCTMKGTPVLFCFVCVIHKEPYSSVVHELFFLELQNIIFSGVGVVDGDLKHSGPQRMGKIQSSYICSMPSPSTGLSQGVTCYIMSFHLLPKRPSPMRVF